MVEAGEVLERHADVDVVGQVPAGVERHDPEPGRPATGATTWVVRRRSVERSMPPCSAMARRRLSTRHTVIHGASHSSGYSHQRPSRRWRAGDEQHDLGGQDPQRDRSGRVGCAARASRPLRFFQPEMPIGVAAQLAAPRGRR